MRSLPVEESGPSWLCTAPHTREVPFAERQKQDGCTPAPLSAGIGHPAMFNTAGERPAPAFADTGAGGAANCFFDENMIQFQG